MTTDPTDGFAEDLPDPGLPPKVAAWFADMRMMHRAWRGDPTNDEKPTCADAHSIVP